MAKVHVNKLPSIIEEYVNAHILSKAPTPTLQFAVGFAMPYVTTSISKMVADTNGIASALGIVLPDGTVDIDQAHSAAVMAMEKAGGKVQAYGINFTRADLDALKSIACNHVGG